MEFEELRTFVGNELKRRFWEHKAMPALSRARGRMDGWLRLELAAILAERLGAEVEPGFKLPKGRAAARGGGWLVEPASLPTDFPFEGTKPAGGDLDEDVRELRKTFKRLRKGKAADQAAVFIAVYPFGDLHDGLWAPHRARLEKALGAPLAEDRFSFQSGVTGRLFAGVVSDKDKDEDEPARAERPEPAARSEPSARPAPRRRRRAPTAA